ncbi:NrfD/PsrC family molybdoenzyme membrane anchor subunit [Rhodopila sp.]|uniref:NrfD/PsrC family molybdoenzyme membrane anchor subunit n=1 Tax=Rhodopila sp. TaxID=2480087 RepID=UPI003D0B97EE
MPSDIAQRPGRFIAPDQTYVTVGREVAGITFLHPRWVLWWLALTASLALVGLLLISLFFLYWQGVGIWGNNIPVAWALDIVSYDWWIGIASGGLLVSALMLLLDMEWRGALNRITETMSVLAVVAAGIYPIIHLGRSWFFYWNLPYPNSMVLWPQFRSPLYWDAVDIISFLLISLTFWYLGLLPDLGTLRDRAFERAVEAKGRGLLRAQLYGIAALGWRGSAVHWQRWTHAYRTVALLGVLLVMSLQAAAAVMFAGTLEPGWHDTLQPVAFVAAALFAGVGVVAMLAVMLRSVFALQPLITTRHMEIVAKLLLALGLINIYCYAQEFFNTYLFGDSYEIATAGRRIAGDGAWSSWGILVCALLPVQLFWIPALRRSAKLLCLVGALVAAGMWADHYMVIVVTLQHDFLPSAARPYSMDVWGVSTLVGVMGLFLFLLLLFLRYIPVVSIIETRQLVPPPNPPRRRG